MHPSTFYSCSVKYGITQEMWESGACGPGTPFHVYEQKLYTYVSYQEVNHFEFGGQLWAILGLVYMLCLSKLALGLLSDCLN